MDKTLMWEEPIHEIKIETSAGLFSFRLGQTLKIRRGNKIEKRIIHDIVREKIDGEITYQVFTTDEYGEDIGITKCFINLPLYISFKG